MTDNPSAELRLDDPQSFTKDFADALDAQDPLRNLREEFIIPTRAGLKRKRLGTDAGAIEVPEAINALLPENELTYPCTYLCGNSLGLQPRRTQDYIRKYLDTWANKGVYGHFQPLEDAVSRPWVDIDEDAKVETATIVGAEPDEVAVMQTLTANLHLLMASFYRPTKERYKIIIEGKAFPSDHVRYTSSNPAQRALTHLASTPYNPNSTTTTCTPPPPSSSSTRPTPQPRTCPPPTSSPSSTSTPPPLPCSSSLASSTTAASSSTSPPSPRTPNRAA